MTSDTRNEIKDTISALASLKKVDKHLAQVINDIKEHEQKLAALGKSLDRELKDFDQLQRLSIKGLFYKVLGSKEEQIEKERQEYLKANLLYQDAVDTLEVMQYEEEVLRKKAAQLPALEERLQGLMDRREKELLEHNGPLADELRSISRAEDQALIIRQDLEEALVAVAQAAQSSAQVVAHLKNAIRWGQWDMSNRRGWGYEQRKRSAIDRAVREASRTQHLLQRVRRELADVGYQGQGLSIELDMNQGFMSVFFDNLISDWIIQQKIVNAKSRVQSITDRLQLVKNHLQQEQSLIEEELMSLGEQRKAVLSK